MERLVPGVTMSRQSRVPGSWRGGVGGEEVTGGVGGGNVIGGPVKRSLVTGTGGVGVVIDAIVS